MLVFYTGVLPWDHQMHHHVYKGTIYCIPCILGGDLKSAKTLSSTSVNEASTIHITMSVRFAIQI